jgi:mono/diheme cytochrome c family protein
MNLSVVCPHCGQTFKVAAKFAGRKGRCPNPRCGKTYTVPQAPLAVADASSEELDAELVELPRPAVARRPERRSRMNWGKRAARKSTRGSFLRRIDRPSFLIGLSTTAVVTVCALLVWSWLPGKIGGGAPNVAAAQNAPDAAPPPRNVFGEDVVPILQKYCAHCHTGDDAQGGFVLTDYRDESGVLKHRHRWERLTNLVSAGVMPPADEPQPSAQEKERLLDYLESTLFHIDCSKITDPGRVTIRRLNRFEYNGTIRDLLGVDFRPADDFPSDDVGHGFDNIGDVLSLPPLLMEKYLAAAEKIARDVILDVDPANPPRKSYAGDQIQRGAAAHPHEDGVIIVSTGEAFVEFEAPLSGAYVLAADAAETPAGDEHAKMEFRLDGKPLQTFEVKNRRSQPQTFEHRLALSRGKHKFAAAFLNDFYDPKNEDKGRRDRNLIVFRFDVRGPVEVSPQDVPEAHRRLVAHHPRDGKSAVECLKENLRPFVPRAFRRPVTDEELQRFVNLGQLALERGESFEFAMQTALTAVLVSPQFLFRIETDKNPLDPNDPHPLNEYELATRLSYFLWSSMPDDELFQHAAKGDLHTDAVLEAQVRRMLKDPKSAALVESFGDQWLNLRILDDVRPDPEKFKDFDAALKDDMKRETRAFIAHVMREDRSVLDFLDGPYTFVNARLAKHYGLPNVEGDQFQQVSLEGTPRAGLITQASILTLTSAPQRTSPVKRGKWMLEVILDQPPPPPPPNVPELAETAKASPDATLRQQLEIHRANPVCASCHETMDALGFGMENFDAVGRFRDSDGGKPLDTTGILPGGKSFHGPKELIAVLKQRDCDFAKALAGKMLTYALGRGLEFYDRCAVDTIVRRLKEKEFKFSVLVSEIVKSRPFRMRRGEGIDP